jgi:hypothetical protein
MEQQFNWDVVFNTGKNKFLNDLSNHKIDPSLASQYGAPLMNALYGLKPYLLSDASKGETVSPTTKQYVLKTILPSLNKTIDDYWGSLGFMKKTSFKMLAKNNTDAIRGTISSGMLTFSYGLIAGLDNAKLKDSGNMYNVIDDLKDFMGYHTSPFVVSAVHKIQSLT